MGLADRPTLYEKIEDHRKCPLIVYATSKRPGADGRMHNDVLPVLTDELSKLPSGAKPIDLLITGYGGDPMVSLRIMSLLRERVDKVSVLIPQCAYSAVTLLALGADKIIMHPNANLGPIDVQIQLSGITEGAPRQFSTEDVEAFLDFVRERLGLTDQETSQNTF